MIPGAHFIPLLKALPFRPAKPTSVGMKRVLASTRLNIGKMAWFADFPLPMSGCLCGLVDDGGKAVGVYHFPHDRPALN